MAEQSLLIFDASGLLYRSFFALPPLTSPSGKPTGALYGFIRSLLKVYHAVSPSHFVSVFDGPKNKESRLKLFPEYKAHRKPTPDDLVIQIEEARRFCTLIGWPMLSFEGVEADDTMASLAMWAKDKLPVYIASLDKDLVQLVSPSIKIINPVKEGIIIDETEVKKEWELTPAQIGDYLSLLGDSSDNIPGVEGIGEKTALELIKEWKSLDNLYDNLMLIGGKKGERLKAGKESAFLSRKLIDLDMNVPVPKELSFYEKHETDKEPILQFFQEMNFKTFESLLGTSKKAPFSYNVELVTTKQAFHEALSYLSTFSELTIDCETTSVDEHTAELVGIGLAHNLERIFYISINHELVANEVVHEINTFIKQKNISLVGHNIKYDLHVLTRYGLEFPKISFDTLIASWVLHAHERTHNLDDLARRHFNSEKIPIESLLGKGKSQKTMKEVPPQEVAKYCGEDVAYTIELHKLFQKELQEAGLIYVFETIEMPLLPILFQMEDVGIYVNREKLASLKETIHALLKEEEKAIYLFAGEEFNINSPKQLSEILYTKLQIPTKGRGKSKFSTNVDILEDLALLYPIAEHILSYRQLEKLRSTYLETLPYQISEKDERVHCHFIQSGTATGRLSCQDPNLQNIPTRSELGKKIREAFEPQKPNWKFVSFDYSQIELRILAHMCKDPALQKAFFEDLDVHAMTASELFNVPLGEVTSEMRHKAKAVNFGVLYGQQAFGLAKELKISTKDAQKFIDHYFARYNTIKQAIEEAKEKARRTHMAETLTKRRRLLPDINCPDAFIRSMQERLAINTPFQGTAADIIKLAMIKVSDWLQKNKMQSKMILQIHDELIFEVPEHELEGIVEHVRILMESSMQLSVPLKVDIAIGKNWKEC